MVDYCGMTINDVAELWGSDYTVYDELYAGGWGYIYYSDRRCPFAFCFDATVTEKFQLPPECNGDEALTAVIIWSVKEDGNILVTDEISTEYTYLEIQQKINGEYGFNDMDEWYIYSFELQNGIRVLFSWEDKKSLPVEIVVGFGV